MKPTIIDFETFYDSDYTLRKLSTSEYIADPRFEVLSCSIYDMEQPVKFYRAHEVAAALAAIDWSQTELVAHHTQFDSLILTHHFDHKPARYACTLAMARFWEQGACDGYSLNDLAAYHGLQGKKGEAPKGKRAADLTEIEWQALQTYNDHDVKLTAWLYLHYVSKLPESERALQSMTLRMFAEPTLCLDRVMLSEALADAKTKKDDVFSKLGISPAVLRSAPKFAALLEGLGVEVPRKISSRTHKETYAFSKKDEEFLALQTHHNEYVRDLVEARMEAASNLAVSRAERLILTHDTYGGLLPVYLKSSTARTHRWGGGDKRNVQNYTRDSKLRASIKAPPEYLIAAPDQAQVEARIAGYITSEDNLTRVFAAGGNVYTDFGEGVYKRPISKDTTPLEYFVSKTCVLGLSFGTAALKLQHSLATDKASPVQLSLTECAGLVQAYRTKYTKIVSTWYWLNDVAIPWLTHGVGDLWLRDCVRFEGGARRIWLPNGTSIHYPGLDAYEGTYVSTGDVVKIYGAKMFENIVQALARVKISEDMLAIDSPTSRVVTMTHDEIVCLVPKHVASVELARIEKIMRASPTWAPTLPLDVKTKMGERYT